MLSNQVDILLVEDDPDDLELTLRALGEYRICNKIQVASDGEEALDFMFCRNAYNERDPDCHPKLILLDLKLPKVDGLEVLRQIKRDPRTKTVPIVILSSSKQESDLIASYHLGANSYIQKPVDFDQFQSSIKKAGYYWLLINHPPIPAVFQGDAPDGIGR